MSKNVIRFQTLNTNTVHVENGFSIIKCVPTYKDRSTRKRVHKKKKQHTLLYNELYLSFRTEFKNNNIIFVRQHKIK